MALIPQTALSQQQQQLQYQMPANQVVRDELVDGMDLHNMTVQDWQLAQLVLKLREQPLSRQETFYLGVGLDGVYPPNPEQPRVSPSQMYVEKITPVCVATHQNSIVLIHGDYQTGQHTKPDGGLGWASVFLELGYVVYIVDLPGVGRSAVQDPDKTKMGAMVRHAVISKQMTDVRIPAGQPRGERQWPGSGQMIDPATGQTDDVFAKLFASFRPLPGGKKERQSKAQYALGCLLRSVKGTATLIGSGSGATMAWLAADIEPDKVSSVVALEPAGPPFCKPFTYNKETKKREYGNYMRFDPTVHQYGLSDVYMNIHPPVSRADGTQHEDGGFFLSEYWGSQGGCLVPSHPHQLVQLQKTEHLILTSPHSHHDLFDWATAAFMQRSGLYVKHSKLEADLGIRGNGPLMFLERNSTEVACIVDRWIRRVAAGKLPPLHEYPALRTAKGLMLPPRFGPGYGRPRQIKCEEDPPAMPPPRPSASASTHNQQQQQATPAPGQRAKRPTWNVFTPATYGTPQANAGSRTSLFPASLSTPLQPYQDTEMGIGYEQHQNNTAATNENNAAGGSKKVLTRAQARAQAQAQPQTQAQAQVENEDDMKYAVTAPDSEKHRVSAVSEQKQQELLEQLRVQQVQLHKEMKYRQQQQQQHQQHQENIRQYQMQQQMLQQRQMLQQQQNQQYFAMGPAAAGVTQRNNQVGMMPRQGGGHPQQVYQQPQMLPQQMSAVAAYHPAINRNAAAAAAAATAPAASGTPTLTAASSATMAAASPVQAFPSSEPGTGNNNTQAGGTSSGWLSDSAHQVRRHMGEVPYSPTALLSPSFILTPQTQAGDHNAANDDDEAGNAVSRVRMPENNQQVKFVIPSILDSYDPENIAATPGIADSGAAVGEGPDAMEGIKTPSPMPDTPPPAQSSEAMTTAAAAAGDDDDDVRMGGADDFGDDLLDSLINFDMPASNEALGPLPGGNSDGVQFDIDNAFGPATFESILRRLDSENRFDSGDDIYGSSRF
ncbi:hypothetical protein N3K66_005785 [Trichothecium roseum]|uniref:Uncharacterized protein n=1 Tax=Trichothecium roseum TaxID=47278 RepID=A0ACC0UYV7_9HYPO|nr:hypothetical protein N3K66_005785 [Trichothecium roseum]